MNENRDTGGWRGDSTVKLALDPNMFRMSSLTETVRTVADLGYEYIELSPRDDFLPFFVHPRADSARVAELRSALRETGVRLASVLPLYRWAGPGEDERKAAVRYWKRAIAISADLGCELMNSEFNGRPDQPEVCEAQFWRSLEELLPVFEREGIALNLEAHPADFCELNDRAVDLVRAIDLPWVNYVFCAPHTFHLDDGRGDIATMIDYAGPKLAQVHLADSLNHRASSGLRYIVNPPDSAARIHQHLDIGQGDVDWDVLFHSLRRIGFDGVATVCVFGCEERARESSAYMLSRVRKELVTGAGKSGR